MDFVGGRTQGEYVERTRDLDPARCLVAAVDVGKSAALALLADHHGQLVGAPVEFALTEPGVARLEAALAAARAARDAVSLRVGVETAGHYHRTLVARLVAGAHDVVELNPAHVKAARATLGSRRLKSDLRDGAAMVELLVRGAGRRPQVRDAAMAAQAAWVAHRRRKIAARTALGNQLLGTLDLVFPGLDGCFGDLLGARAGRLIVAELADPDRMRRLGVDGLRRFCHRRGVALRRPKAAQLIAAAQAALRLPAGEHAVRLVLLRAEVALLAALEADIAAAEAELASVLPDTPAGVLSSLPGVAVIRASAYGAALGDPARYPDAAAAYRASGLVPAAYESAGRARGRQAISREGSVELRRAILELGRGLGRSEPDFVRYRRELTARGKPAGVVAIAVAHRAHRLAFALIRTEQSYDPGRWATSVATKGERKERQAGGPVRTTRRQAASRDDVTRPPGSTVPAPARRDNLAVPV